MDAEMKESVPLSNWSHQKQRVDTIIKIPQALYYDENIHRVSRKEI